MTSWLSTAVLLPPALWTALPAVADAWTALAGGRGAPLPPVRKDGERPKLIFLVPAHDEELLIERCVKSLVTQDYPQDSYTVAVIADNCTDKTAARAREFGATVLERHDTSARGKHHAIAWALTQVPIDEYAAFIARETARAAIPGQRVLLAPADAGRLSELQSRLDTLGVNVTVSGEATGLKRGARIEGDGVRVEVSPAAYVAEHHADMLQVAVRALFPEEG